MLRKPLAPLICSTILNHTHTPIEMRSWRQTYGWRVGSFRARKLLSGTERTSVLIIPGLMMGSGKSRKRLRRSRNAQQCWIKFLNDSMACKGVSMKSTRL